MFANRTGEARHEATGCGLTAFSNQTAPRAPFSWRLGFPVSIGFALTLLVLGGILPAVGLLISPAEAATLPRESLPASATAGERFTHRLDHDRNGIEDLLDRWHAGAVQWSALQQAVQPPLTAGAGATKSGLPDGPAPASAVVANGQVRVLCLGARAGQLTAATESAARAGVCRVIHDLERFGGVTVLAVDDMGLRELLNHEPVGAVMLDRDGVPALVDSRHLVGVGRVTSGDLELGNDWSGTVAVLDSGLDTAHGDLGDPQDDDSDGPPPAVGDQRDWFDAANGWPLFEGFKVVGWHDVTDDFPESQGPWDYHHHGTALASVVAGSGSVDPDYRGVAAGGRLTVVKCYDFDEIWHAWAGDFLAACAWVLDHQDTYRIRTVLMAVNWTEDAGISSAVAALVQAGMLPVAAMGNFGLEQISPGFPAVLPDVLTAGASNAAGAVSAYSGRGRTGTFKPDLIAPGGGLLQSAGRIVAADIDPDDSYSGRFGTSLAAAHLAGAAFLLDEALLENGIVPARDRAGVKSRQSILKLATAFVPLAESQDGTGTVSLPAYAGQDAERGFGHLRVDAAVHAMIDPLLPGQEQADTVSSDWRQPVAARRLGASSGVRYLVEAIPTGSLDISLEVVTLNWGESPNDGEHITRVNLSGPGVSEFTYFQAEPASWSFVVAKRLSGGGLLTLRMLEADSFTQQGNALTLPGLGSGAPSMGNLAPFVGPSLIIPSRVLVDPIARSLSVLDLDGNFRPGWPVFVFPNSSSQGGLTQPMVANLDGVQGDEFVVASDFGTVYFFTGNGSYKTVNLELNRWLAAPVGFQNAVGGWRVLVVDKLGWARTWSWNAAVNADPELESEVFLNHDLPLSPAAGRLTAEGGESLVVTFVDGWIGVLDEALTLRSGWPLDLGMTLEVAPVLCDLDSDGLHEIVLPVRDTVSGQLIMRVFDGSGAPLPFDGAVVPAPAGGHWLQISEAVVSGAYGTGGLNIAVAGLTDNGLSGDDVVWSLALGRQMAGGSTAVTDLAGFTLRATADEGELRLTNLLLPTPLAWDQSGGFGTETATLFHFQWDDVLFGFTTLPGATTGWLLGGAPDEALLQKQPLLLGGARQENVAYLGGMLVPLADGVHLRVEVIDRELNLAPVLAGTGNSALWMARRGDFRNSGAFPLREGPTAVPLAPAPAGELRAYPNPGSGRFEFRADSEPRWAGAQLEIFDLRGHRITRISGAAAPGQWSWDGTDARGRRQAAGTYLAVIRNRGDRLTTRVILTR